MGYLRYNAEVNTPMVHQIPTNGRGLPLITPDEAAALAELTAAHEQYRAALDQCSSAPSLDLPWHISQDLRAAQTRLANARKSAYLATRSAA